MITTVFYLFNYFLKSIIATYGTPYDSEKKHALEAWGKKLKQMVDLTKNADNVVDINDHTNRKEAQL